MSPNLRHKFFNFGPLPIKICNNDDINFKTHIHFLYTKLSRNRKKYLLYYIMPFSNPTYILYCITIFGHLPTQSILTQYKHSQKAFKLIEGLKFCQSNKPAFKKLNILELELGKFKQKHFSIKFPENF